MNLPFRPCAIIPVYNHHTALPGVVEALLAAGLPVLLVDDGSEAQCHAVMAAVAAQHSDVQLVQHPRNRGKGAAVKTGLSTAQSQGYSHAVQVDADGQHCLDDLPRLLELAQSEPHALVTGYPAFDASVPRARYYGRYATHVWVWINTLSTEIRDSMCGFRVYPVAESCQLIQSNRLGDRMDFDTEFIVHWHWSEQPVRQLATPVRYPVDGVSHFRLWRDNGLISLMHARLFFGMLWRLPRLLRRSRTTA